MKRVNSKCSSVQLRTNSVIYSHHSRLVWTHLKSNSTTEQTASDLCVSPAGPADRSSRNPRSWWRISWGCRARCSRVWGHSGWCSAQAWPGTAARCTAAEQTCASGSETRRGSSCSSAGRTGYRTTSRRPDTSGSGTWSGASDELEDEHR